MGSGYLGSEVGRGYLFGDQGVGSLKIQVS